MMHMGVVIVKSVVVAVQVRNDHYNIDQTGITDLLCVLLYKTWEDPAWAGTCTWLDYLSAHACTCTCGY